MHKPDPTPPLLELAGETPSEPTAPFRVVPGRCLVAPGNELVCAPDGFRIKAEHMAIPGFAALRATAAAPRPTAVPGLGAPAAVRAGTEG